MNLKEAIKRIEELEGRIRQLESQQHIHYHYHQQQPVYQPLAPMQPNPYSPYPWRTTCGLGMQGGIESIAQSFS